MPDRPDYFRCPLCRGVSCERVIVKRPNGTAYVTAFFSCTVCTLMFRDPRALTRGFEDRPREGPARSQPPHNEPPRNESLRHEPPHEPLRQGLNANRYQPGLKPR
jgi:hypothetical protein